MKTLLAGTLGAVCLAPQQPTFRARVDAIQIDVLVVAGGQPVRGLGPGDFEVRDNGVLQKIDSVEAGDVALDLTLVLDTSSSVEGRPLKDLQTAARAAVHALRPEVDTVSLMPFGHEILRHARAVSDHAAVERAISDMAAGGGTSLIDAVTAALLMPAPGPRVRRLVIVCSDGSDTYSWLEPNELRETARRSESVVYAVIAGPQESNATSTVLRDVATTTGGRLLGVSGTLARVFGEIVREFRNRYVVTYSPRGVNAGGWHNIEIRTSRGRAVGGRKGYFDDRF